MDPSIELCRVRNSFEGRVEVESFDQYACPPGLAPVTLDIRTVPKAAIGDVPVEFVDVGQYQALQKMKDGFAAIPNFLAFRNAANPFEGIGGSGSGGGGGVKAEETGEGKPARPRQRDQRGRQGRRDPDPFGIFFDRAGIKIANIDAIFNVSLSEGDYLARTTPSKFTFCDVAGGPGAWTQYFQFRRSESRGYGITLRGGDNDWEKRIIDMDRFSAYYGPKPTGNLYQYAFSFAEYVRKTEGGGVDLVAADGGTDVEGIEVNQEMENSRLIFSEICSALSCLAVGGNLVLKIYDTVRKVSIDAMYILASCFEKLFVFKPMSSRPANAEKYVIGLKLKDGIQDYIDICRQVYETYTDDTYVAGIFGDLDPAFVGWMTWANDTHVQQQTYYVSAILAIAKGQEFPMAVYNLFRPVALWNLPSASELVYQAERPLPPKVFTDRDFLVEDGDPQRPYERRTDEEKTAVAWGQRKLLLALIQFLTRFWRAEDVRLPKIVYAGAAPGNNIQIVSRLFRTAEFHLYDPAPFRVNPSGKIQIYNREFTDADAKGWAGRDDVYFISDIRSNAKSEVAIAKDMQDQMRWVNLMNPRAAQLKFRLPYSGTDVSTDVEYFEGQVFKQAWTRPTSTETRLVPFAARTTKVWDARKYEGQMYYHNVMIREKQKFVNPFTLDLTPVSDGQLVNDYDSTLEVMILREYREKFGMLSGPVEIQRMSDLLTSELNYGKQEKYRKNLEAIRKSPARFKRE